MSSFLAQAARDSAAGVNSRFFNTVKSK